MLLAGSHLLLGRSLGSPHRAHDRARRGRQLELRHRRAGGHAPLVAVSGVVGVVGARRRRRGGVVGRGLRRPVERLPPRGGQQGRGAGSDGVAEPRLVNRGHLELGGRAPAAAELLRPLGGGEAAAAEDAGHEEEDLEEVLAEPAKERRG